jgi:hypothetical protein
VVDDWIVRSDRPSQCDVLSNFALGSEKHRFPSTSNNSSAYRAARSPSIGRSSARHARGTWPKRSFLAAANSQSMFGILFALRSIRLRCGMATTLLRLHVLRYFLNETMALRESPTDGLEEGSVSLSASRLGRRISTGGRWRGGGEPEPNEESKRLRSDNQVTLKTFGLAGKAIEAAREGGLESICRVGGEKRSDRGLDDN